MVAMNHLDIGFDGIHPIIGYAFNVLNKYFDVYFPMAINVSNTIRSQSNGALHYIYTTHPYLVSLYLDCPTQPWTWPAPGMAPHSPIPPSLHCPSANAVAAFKAAIHRGDITWHAFPFNSEPELYDDSLFVSSLQIAKRLDKQFNKKPTITMSQRDVPGMTRAVIPLLHKEGIAAITVGVNGASSPPAVDKLFTWQDPASQTEVYAMWHPGGYGGIDISDCVLLGDQALAMAFNTDNAGPHTVPEAMKLFAQLKREFPNAVVNGSTWDAFVEKVVEMRPTLPVVTGEIGDTWIHGAASDPLKLAQFRETLRQRKSCIASGKCNVEDSEMQAFDRLLTKVGEHTWGLDVKTFLGDWVNWTNAEFHKANASSSVGYKLMSNSWIEQRSFITNALSILASSNKEQYRALATDIKNAFAQLTPNSDPSTRGLSEVPASERTNPIDLGHEFTLRFDASGAVVSLLDKKTTSNWASPKSPLGVYTCQTFDQSSYDTFFSEYFYCPVSICGWAAMDFGKPDVTRGNPRVQNYTTKLTNMWKSDTRILLQLKVDTYAVIYGGAPQNIWVEYEAGDRQINIRLLLSNKTSTRLPEAHWFSFMPDRSANPGQWIFSKLGADVNPFDVVLNGSQHIHGVDEDGARYYSRSRHGLRIATWDAALVSAGILSPFPTPLTPNHDDGTVGIHVNLYNNIWGTNYIMWYPFDVEHDAYIPYRFTVSFVDD
eukprot:TRINITY_DN10754_c0_g1_i1.p1 TRINITY_DN10754_c0_g1~~TRINITY_DN10754_c0_g1_i1.p1  ORF type:complete len:714 (-),score=88.74 TRINITY_DN10754_c0_g1_i1:50-2191(-)